ncbi:acetyltransferase, GNAT family, partial [Bacillus cereus G9241]
MILFFIIVITKDTELMKLIVKLKRWKVVIFSIIDKNNNELLGVMNLNLDHIHKRGELAYWIGRPYWGNGFGTEAAKALLHYGFNELHLNKIFATAFTNNPGS